MCLCFFFYQFIFNFTINVLCHDMLCTPYVCTAYMCHSVTKRMADEYVCNELYQERKRPEIVSKASQNIKFVL